MSTKSIFALRSGQGVGLPLVTEQNPWRRLSSRPIYTNPWIHVREDQVIRPDGNPGIYGVVELQTWAIGVVPLTDDAQLATGEDFDLRRAEEHAPRITQNHLRPKHTHCLAGYCRRLAAKQCVAPGE